jgi:hypothetical protein
MPWLDTLGLAGETAATVAEAAAVGAAPVEALPVAGAALLGGAALGAHHLYRRMQRARTPARTPARRVRRRLAYGTPARTPAPMVTVPRANLRTGGRMGKEIKYNDQFHATGGTLVQAVAGSLINPTTSNNLIGVAQGDGPTDRIGRVIFLKSLYIQGNMQLPLDTAPASHWYITLYVVQDKQTNKTAFTETTFLKQQNILTAPDSFQNLDYSDRYRLLKKKVVRIGSRTQNATNDGRVAIPFKIYIPLSNLRCQYDGTSGAIGTMTTNSLHLMCIKSVEAPGDLAVNYNVRVRFTD